MSSTQPKAGQQLPTRPEFSDVLAPASTSNGSTNEAMSTSNRSTDDAMSTSKQQADQAKPHPKLTTQAEYIATDIMTRDSIEYTIKELEGLCAPCENASSSVLQLHQKTLSILRQALDHSSPVVSLNLECLAEGMFQSRYEIDDSNTTQYSKDHERIEDPDVNVESSKAAKLRFVKFMEDEAMILGNKDMENFLIWVRSLAG